MVNMAPMGADLKDAFDGVIESKRGSDSKGESEAEQTSRLNTTLSLLVALSATFMALCNVKDGNVVQAMAQAQGNSINAWNYYQAKSVKQHLTEASIDEMIFQRQISALAPADRESIDRRMADYRARAARYETEKAELKTQAEAHTREYDRLNIHDDQLDIAEATFSLSIALYGITALTHKRWLLGLGGMFSLIGTVFGLSGFMGWSLHPDWLARLLS